MTADATPDDEHPPALTPPRTLVVNGTTGRVHRKTCGSVNYLTMFTMKANLFRTLWSELDYSKERGWMSCRRCHPFREDA